VSDLARRALERFDAKVLVVENGCHEWQSTLTHNGYGLFWFNGKHVLAHRFGWEAQRDPIPAKLTIDHLCRNRRCVNVEHLEVVDLRTNILRGNGTSARNIRKTHCAQGHPFNERNTGHRATGVRYCRECGRIRNERDRERRNAEKRERYRTDPVFRARELTRRAVQPDRLKANLSEGL
jgi:hypothetical protein